MNRVTITSQPFSDQKPGASGLRKKVKHFQQPHYLENFVQSIFNATASAEDSFADKTLVVGGDGRFYNQEAIQIIIKMAAANSFGKVIAAQNGLLSTPAASCVIRKNQALSLTGQAFGSYQVEAADDFAYTDPVDGSLNQHQGIRILMQYGSRIIYRLSGTGTKGATLRVYIEGREADPEKQSDDPQNALAELISLTGQIAKIKQFTGRTKPDVVT